MPTKHRFISYIKITRNTIIRNFNKGILLRPMSRNTIKTKVVKSTFTEVNCERFDFKHINYRAAVKLSISKNLYICSLLCVLVIDVKLLAFILYNFIIVATIGPYLLQHIIYSNYELILVELTIQSIFIVHEKQQQIRFLSSSAVSQRRFF